MKIMVSAGEVSGDIHAAYLVRELKRLAPKIEFFGMGSERLAAEGVEIYFDIARRGTIGILEALPNLFPVYSTYLKLISLMKKERPDLLLLVDSQGINLPLAKAARSLGIKTVYYIAPQEWLWGSPRGVRKVAETVDLIVAIFKKEYEAYQRAGANVIYFGHPLLDIVQSSAIKEKGLVALCPGSRPQEIKSLLPILLDAAEMIKKDLPDTHFVIPAASAEVADMIRENARANASFQIVPGKTYDILASAELALCASGTINLETSLLGTPNIMVYKLSGLTYWIGMHVFRIGDKISYFSMPNILMDKKVIPELVMGNATPGPLAAEAIDLLRNAKRREAMLEDFKALKKLLGEPGVIAKVASAIL